MRRLFWKFFAGLLLAQLTTTAVVVSLIWFRDGPHLRQIEAPPGLEARLNAPLSIQSASPEPPPPGGGPHTPRFPARPLLIGICTSLVFAYFFARYFSKPIAVLNQGFREIGAGRFGYQVSPSLGGRRDELADLGRAFDRMAVQLHRLVDSQKRLLHDVSHEVRSPLARMQLAIDLLAQQPERQRELLQRIDRESSRINALMGEVLTLARLETAATWPMADQIDLIELVGEVVHDVSFEAAQTPCLLATDLPPESVVIQGNAELLHRAMENILRNAIRYTAQGSSVNVRVHAEEAQWCIDISDYGPGILETQLSRMFDPFERLGQADTSPGYGLGLAIAAQTLKIHGGVISAVNITHPDAHTGLCVSMKLPK